MTVSAVTGAPVYLQPETGVFSFFDQEVLADALQNPPYFDVYGESLTRTIVDNNFKP